MDSPTPDDASTPTAVSLRRAASSSKRSQAVSGGGSKRGSSTRLHELELEHEGALAGVSVSGSTGGAGGFAPGAALAQGLRRIHSSPSMAAAAAAAAAAVSSSAASASGSKAGSQSSSRKKTTNGAVSADMKNVQATKAARRLARKAEAARQSRRRKKAALGDMEETLQKLEARHAELLKMQKAGGGGGARGAGAGAAGGTSKNAAAVAAARLRAAATSSPAPASSSNSPRIHSARHESDTASASADSFASPSPAMASSLAHRFSMVLSFLSRHRSEQVQEKLEFLMQHTAPRSQVSGFLMWLLSRGHAPNGDAASATMASVPAVAGAPLQPQPPALPPASDFAVPSSLPPNPLSIAPTDDARNVWLDLFRGVLGLSAQSYAALQGPRLHGATVALLDSSEGLQGALGRLAVQFEAHLAARQTHNQAALFGLFTPRQQEILAQTAFKQQQQAANAAQQQQQAQAQQLKPQALQPQPQQVMHHPTQQQQQQHQQPLPPQQLFPRSASPLQPHAQQHHALQLQQFPAPRAGPASYGAAVFATGHASSAPQQASPQSHPSFQGFPQLHLSPRMQPPQMPAGLNPRAVLSSHVPQQQHPPSSDTHSMHPSQLPSLFLPAHAHDRDRGHTLSPESPMHAPSERMMAYDPGEHSAYHGQ